MPSVDQDSTGHSNSTENAGHQGQVEQSGSPTNTHQQGQAMLPVNARRKMPKALGNPLTYNNPDLRE